MRRPDHLINLLGTERYLILLLGRDRQMGHVALKAHLIQLLMTYIVCTNEVLCSTINFAQLDLNHFSQFRDFVLEVAGTVVKSVIKLRLPWIPS